MVGEGGEQPGRGRRREEGAHVVPENRQQAHALGLEPLTVAAHPQRPRKRKRDVRERGPDLIRDRLSQRLPPMRNLQLHRHEAVLGHRDEVRASTRDGHLGNRAEPGGREVADERGEEVRLVHPCPNAGRTING